jgi:hypothetical protein
VTLRCTLDGLLLCAEFTPANEMVVYDGDESFVLEAVEALFYQLVSATREELLTLEQSRYRLLRPAGDFQFAAD